MIQSIYDFWISWLGSLNFSSPIWEHAYDYAVHILSWSTVGFALFLAFFTIFSLVRLVVRFFR